MPCDLTSYPANWQELRRQILARARLRCECTGQCGLHGGTRSPRRCVERHRAPASFAQGRITLALAHLCSCEPLCANPAHILALCQRCHLRIDRFKHAATRKTRALDRTEGGGGAERTGKRPVLPSPGGDGQKPREAPPLRPLSPPNKN
jgi:hypothetical protein